MNTEPTDEQINRGIAEWRGENVICVLSSCIVVAEKSGGRTKPLLTKSHDACHEALERMTEEQVDDYSYELYKLVDPDGSILNVNALMVKASARQKALAIYQVVMQAAGLERGAR